MGIKCDTQILESYRTYIKSFYRTQSDAVKKLKKKCENANWHDSVYNEVINDLNAVLSEIASAIAELTDGSKVRILDGLIPLAEQYAKTASRYPH